SGFIEEDSPLPSSPATIACHSRLWRNIPHSLWPLWLATCRPYFRAFSVASLAGDVRGIQRSLITLFNLPRISLIRSRGGKKNRATRSLASQLRISPLSSPYSY